MNGLKFNYHNHMCFTFEHLTSIDMLYCNLKEQQSMLKLRTFQESHCSVTM